VTPGARRCCARPVLDRVALDFEPRRVRLLKSLQRSRPRAGSRPGSSGLIVPRPFPSPRGPWLVGGAIGGEVAGAGPGDGIWAGTLKAAVATTSQAMTVVSRMSSLRYHQAGHGIGLHSDCRRWQPQVGHSRSQSPNVPLKDQHGMCWSSKMVYLRAECLLEGTGVICSMIATPAVSGVRALRVH